jgi:hypothetical protein
MKILWFTNTPSLAEDYLNNKQMNGGFIKSLEKLIKDKVDLSIAFYHSEELPPFKLENDVYTTLRYHPLHLNPLYNQMNVRLPNCEILNEDCLSIPLHPRLDENDVDKIVDLIKKFGIKNNL